MKIPLPITPKELPRLRELGSKHGVTWKGREHTDASPVLTEHMAALLSRFDDELAFTVARQTGDTSEAVKLGEKILAERADARQCGPLWRERENKRLADARRRRSRAAIRSLELSPFNNLAAVLPILKLQLDMESCYVRFVGRAVDADTDAVPAQQRIDSWDCPDPLLSSVSGNWSEMYDPDDELGGWRRHPALGNLRKHWREFQGGLAVGCANAAFTAWASPNSTEGCDWFASIEFSANHEIAWRFSGWAGQQPTRRTILLACWVALIEAGQIGNPCLDNPRQLDSLENYDQCDGMY